MSNERNLEGLDRSITSLWWDKRYPTEKILSALIKGRGGKIIKLLINHISFAFQAGFHYQKIKSHKSNGETHCDHEEKKVKANKYVESMPTIRWWPSFVAGRGAAFLNTLFSSR